MVSTSESEIQFIIIMPINALYML